MKPGEKNVADRPMPQSDAAITGGTHGALGGASVADLKRGYTTPSEADRAEPMFLDMDAVSDDPVEPGFLGRPHGWER